MREWIEYIIIMNPRLDKLCGRLEERIDENALNIYKPAKKGIAEIEGLNQIKFKLINLRVMYDALTKRLKPDELAVLNFKDESLKRFNRSTLCRKRKAATLKAALILEGLGFDKERLINEYHPIKEEGFVF